MSNLVSFYVKKTQKIKCQGKLETYTHIREINVNDLFH